MADRPRADWPACFDHHASRSACCFAQADGRQADGWRADVGWSICFAKYLLLAQCLRAGAHLRSRDWQKLGSIVNNWRCCCTP
mmetsp:Transcript_19262/g.49725  ORF Transcript_19262/g.49725 Transcript_19262/m.49725 type:complete len:83 (-) Transcript_19262:133-381(-)